MVKTGRPSKIHSIDLKEITFCAAKGYTDKQFAKIFGVTEQTINNWKNDYPVFFESLKDGKLLADAKVEASLYQRACGYSHPEVHITNYLGKIKCTPIIKHYPPDPTSMIFWLKNRKKDEWRDKHEIDVNNYLNEKYDDMKDKEVEIKARELANRLIEFSATSNRN